uniref:Uncharacterized protein n=1 Tax=Anopheles darlingi TaxID=43151 RepID=A0A2M4DB86_ANODA
MSSSTALLISIMYLGYASFPTTLFATEEMLLFSSLDLGSSILVHSVLLIMPVQAGASLLFLFYVLLVKGFSQILFLTPSYL